MATKEKHKRRNDPNAYPAKNVYLNISRPAEENEHGHRYDFRFLTPEQAKKETDAYYPLPDILDLPNAAGSVNKWVADRNLSGNGFSFETLYGLYQLVHDSRTISHYLETEQDLDRVLNIFIRVNSGATKLSYSDLLMSIAAAQWSEDDARQMIHGLVDDLNAVGDGYTFSKDFVLKAGLMLKDIASVGFKVENFNKANMETLRKHWDRVASTLQTTVSLVADYGLTKESITADSALLPIAYFLHHHPEPEKFASAAKHRPHREAVRLFLVRSLLKRGVWGAGLDVTLTALREALRKHRGDAFPVGPMEAALKKRGRGIDFSPDEIDELLNTSYGHKQAVPLLSLLFDHVDLKHKMHVDHVYPRSLLTRPKLNKAGITGDEAERITDQRDLLPNLQLLDGSANQEKSGKPPAVWLRKHLPAAKDQRHYRDLHLLGDLPAGPANFAAFFDARRHKMHQQLDRLLTTTPQNRSAPSPD